MTTLTLTPNFTTKTLIKVGEVAVGESVSLSIVGVSQAQAANLRVRMRYDKVNVAIYPRVAEDVWTHSGSTAVGQIELNTVEFREVFEDDDDRGSHEVIVIVENTDDQNMYAEGRIRVKNWPADAGDAVPYDLSGYQDTVAGLVADLALARVDINSATALIASHSHNGSGSVVIDHNNLGNKGENTHAQIDAALTATAASLNTVSGEATQTRNDLNEIKVICETVKGMPNGTAAQVRAQISVLLDGIIASLTNT